jgi:hypothetical protein
VTAYLAMAEAAWAWVLDRVRYDDGGVWIPISSEATEPAWDRDGVHSGVGGLVQALTVIASVRPWTTEESALAAAVAARLEARVPEETIPNWFDGLAGELQSLALLGRPVDGCVERLLALGPADWEHWNDVTLGTASVLRAGLVAMDAGSARGADLATYAADLLIAEAEETPAGLNWLFVPRRHVPPDKLKQGRPVEMPNWSHGLAGIAGTLARAGLALDRRDLVDAARLGAEHLVTLATPASLEGGGFAVPREVPHWKPESDELTWNWCHGPAGTLGLFEALGAAGVGEVAGDPPAAYIRRCIRSLRTSGIPERRYPGFWDNDGRCCGTAGVGAAVLPHDRDFALQLAATLVDRAHVDGDRAYWRFIEHRNAEPLLPPGVGWMQGAAGIAAFLFEVAA